MFVVTLDNVKVVPTAVLTVSLAAAVVVVAAGSVAGPLTSVPDARPPADVVPRAPRTVTLSVSPSSGPLPGVAVAASAIRGAAVGRTAAQAIGPLMGSLAPVAVPSPDGRKLAYST